MSQEKAVRRREVRRPGWPCDGTKTWYDASRKDGSHLVQWSARTVQYCVDVRVTVNMPSSEEWGPLISKSDTPNQTASKWLLLEHTVWLFVAAVSAVSCTDIPVELKIGLVRHNAPAPGRQHRRRYFFKNKMLTLKGILLLIFHNFLFLTFNPIHESNDLKIVTFCCSILCKYFI